MKLLKIYLVLINIAAFIVMAVDKHRAVNNRWRIREATLFAVAAAGGSLGAMLCMLLLRHKTRHKSFMIGLPLILAAQIVIFAVIR